MSVTNDVSKLVKIISDILVHLENMQRVERSLFFHNNNTSLSVELK